MQDDSQQAKGLSSHRYNKMIQKLWMRAENTKIFKKKQIW